MQQERDCRALWHKPGHKPGISLPSLPFETTAASILGQKTKAAGEIRRPSCIKPIPTECVMSVSI